jgi:hypothetical protein
MKKYSFKGIEFSVKELEHYIIGIKKLLKRETLPKIIFREKPHHFLTYVNKLRSLKIIAFDPGPKNFAYAIIKDDIVTGMLRNPVNILKDSNIFNEQIKKFSLEMKKLIYGVDYIIIERFIARGRFGGFMGECINIMIGIIAYFSKGKVILITAATHKNFFKHMYSIKKKDFQNLIIKKKLQPHEKDAIMMGLYFLHTKGYSRTLIKRIINVFNRS